MLQNDKRIRIIAGHYGSGKTEFAVNYAAKLSEITNKKIALADMDIVNVYFRSREKRAELEAMGVKVIFSSIPSGATADLPAMTGEILLPIKDKSYDYIIDLGGNDVGTVTLGRVKPILDHSEVDFFMVVNINRPDTSDVDKIITQMNQIEYSSGIKFTGFVNNTNLVRETTAENILLGDEILREVSRKTGVPIKYTTYVSEVVGEEIIAGKVAGEIFPLKFYMREPWM